MDLSYKPFEDITNVKDGTPANAFLRFFYAFKERNPDKMLEVCQKTWKSKPKAREKLELWFGTLFLKGMKITEIKRISDTVYDVTARVGIKPRKQQQSLVTLVTGRVICESHPYTPSKMGTWGVNPLSVLKGLGIVKKIYFDEQFFE